MAHVLLPFLGLGLREMGSRFRMCRPGPRSIKDVGDYLFSPGVDSK